MKTKTLNIKNQKIKCGINEEGTVYLFVYGTSNFKKGWMNFCADILCSLKCWKRPVILYDNKKLCFRRYYFHAGSVDAAEMIMENKEFRDAIIGRDVILAGHSMGTLCQTLGALIEIEKIAIVQKCFVFGGYGVTDDPDVFTFPIWFVNQGYDIVPLLFSRRFKQGKGEILPTLGKGSWPFRFYYDHVDYDYECFWGYRL